uniref:Protein unc-93 homolog A n=1 Tax=Leptobrachium leishanense TaxID=445787 RepID=A0A8C5PQP4_9ANUR
IGPLSPPVLFVKCCSLYLLMIFFSPQSSLNPLEGLGVVSLSVIYGSQIFSSIVLTPFIICKLGCKWTIIISMCVYITYTLANFYPKWYTLIPTSVLVGIAGSPFWTAQCTYLTLSAKQYALKAGKMKTHIISQYFGIFFFIFQSSRIWGNLISSLILNFARRKVSIIQNLDNTSCGVSDNLPTLTTGNINHSESTTTNSSGYLVYTILGTYVGMIKFIFLVYFLCYIFNIIIYLTLSLLRTCGEKKKNDESRQDFLTNLLVTLKHLRDRRQWLLIPLTMYSGVEQGFILSDYTKSYVTCSLGMEFVGYVIIVFGAMTSVCSFLFGKLCKYISRIFFFNLAAATNIICIAVLFVWAPSPEQLGVFFIFSGLWGLADAVWQTLVNALYGILFEDNREAAFANYLLWKSLGHFLSFGYSSFLRVNIKLCILLFILVVGMVLYGTVEYIEGKKMKIVLSRENIDMPV